MVYDPNVPQPDDEFADSQDDLLQNFGQLNSQFAINHLPFASTTQQGYHTKVFFAAPLVADPNLASTESSLYTKTVSAATQLFFQNGAAPTNVTQLTGIAPTNVGANFFFNILGLKVATGQFTAIGSIATITFAGTFTSVISCTGTQIDTIGGSRACTISAGTLTNTGVHINTSNNGVSGYYIAIGT